VHGRPPRETRAAFVASGVRSARYGGGIGIGVLGAGVGEPRRDSKRTSDGPSSGATEVSPLGRLVRDEGQTRDRSASKT
jgi:hypothetical protein